MVIRPLTPQALSRLLLTGVAVTLFATVVSCSSSVTPTDALADDAKSAATAKAEETDPDYAVPDGTPKEILDFITKLQKRRPKFANRGEMIDHAIKVQRAIITAGDKILKLEPDDELVERAAEMKLNSLITLAANQIPGTAKEALDTVTLMKKDSNKIVAKAAAEKWLTVRILNVTEMKEADRSSLVEEVITSADKKNFDRSVMGNVMQLGQALEESPDPKEVVAYYTKVADLAEHHGTPQLKEVAERMRGTVRRVSLPGNPMQIEAKLLDGKPFDWASYRGKVVLVDFWATWCGPCIGELPNVKENYKKYHDKGFDVVGISLDRSRAALDKFIEKEELPWAQLYDEEIQEGTGWNHPVARYYGISGIPAAILVDKDGKVVSMNARGPELTKQLEKLLGKAE
ncbi:MAG: TlpA family protein disulfide reductase [Candidatus Saccharimonas sp.]|nr:TlpA family protein disulfide reductase [Planctomycetaceae bacterium]